MAIIAVFCVFLCSCLGVSGGKLVIHFRTLHCEAPRGEECVEIRNCPFFVDLLDQNPIPRSRGIVDIIRAHQCDFQANVPYVCCNKTIPTMHPPPPEPGPVIETTTIRHRGMVSLADRFSELLVTHRNYHLLPRKECGQIMTNRRITNGKATDINEYPWMVLIAYETERERQGVVFKCAGTLISERFVLTAAHCMSDSTMVGVRLGEYNMDKKVDCDSDTGYCSPPPQDLFIEYFVTHPEYDQHMLLNDIALIKLDGPANFSFDNVQPICLPSQDFDLSGKIAVVSGWGVTEKGFRSPVLRKASIPVVKLSSCQRTYRKFAPVSEKQICAGGQGGRDSCAGDSGGPLKYVGMVEGSPRFVQYGIVSYGPKQCGTDGKPGIYTKVFSYMKWILDQLDT
ncbi:hypothetical protein JTB14_016950 [Gonioctena quinquepunctata]|nr:hypothetical protein JTB14_016950 [Gonioctena quinquepunctata]